MRTKTEFVKRWKEYVAGMVLYGSISETRDGPLIRARHIVDVTDRLESLLGDMYDYVAKSVEQPKADPTRTNGHAVLPLPQRKVTP